jgi:ribosome biogenesis protein ERB1
MNCSEILLRQGHSEDAIHYLIPPFISAGMHALTTSLLNPANLPPRPESSSPSLKWVATPATSTARATKASSHSAPALTVLLPAGSGLPKQIVFHRKGDYLASVCKLSAGRVVRETYVMA